MSVTRTDARKALKLPTKTWVNLAKREDNSKNVATVVLGIFAIAVLSFCVAKFGVIDQLARQQEAESAYNAVHAQYTAMQASVSQYPEIEQEYRTYSRSWMQKEDSAMFVRVDRMDVLDLIETQLMPNGTVNTVYVQGDIMTVTMSGMNLTGISDMFRSLQQQSIVESASLNIASTTQDTPEEDELDFSITIVLKSEEETQ